MYTMIERLPITDRVQYPALLHYVSACGGSNCSDRCWAVRGHLCSHMELPYCTWSWSNHNGNFGLAFFGKTLFIYSLKQKSGVMVITWCHILLIPYVHGMIFFYAGCLLLWLQKWMPLEVKVSTRCTVVKLFTWFVKILSLYYWYCYYYCRRFRICIIDADTHSFWRLFLGFFICTSKSISILSIHVYR